VWLLALAATTPGGCATARPHHRRAPAATAVAGRSVRLSDVAVRLFDARRCRRPPRPGGGRSVLSLRDVQAAGCRTTPRRTPVPARVTGSFGTVAIGALRPDPDGWVRITVVDLERRLAAAGAAFDEAERLLLGGPRAPAVVRLDRLRALRARWHAAWVARGVGAPAAFAALHPAHPAAGWARAAAFEALLARQERAFRRALSDPAAAVAFLRRHAWSPYRASVQASLSGHPSKTGRAAPARP